MSGWKEANLDVLKEIHLDPKNVRLENVDAKVEADIMEDLFANEDALQLVEGICKIGFLTHEIPVVIFRQDKYIMVEGNRRLAALKAIQNPMLVPDFQKRVSTLAALLPDRKMFSKIQVKIAPSQDDVDQLVAAIHTGNLRRPWAPGRQAAFFQAQIDAGRTLEELLIRYPTIDVKNFVFRAHVLNLFKTIEYDDPKLKLFITSSKWTRGLSTLARIYGSKEFVSLTGLAMDNTGRITKSISDDGFKDMATVIVRGMFEQSIDTRSLNSVKSPRFTHLMTELNEIQADEMKTAVKSNTGTATGTPLIKNDSTKSSPTTSRPGRVSKKNFLDLSQCKTPNAYPVALKDLLGEISALNIQQFPNATFLALRAALEKSIKSFAEAKSEDIRKTTHDGKGFVQLGHCLDWLLAYVKKDGTKYLIAVIERVRTGKLNSYMGTKDALNSVNHNHQLMVDREEVIGMWSSIDPIMRYLMKL